MVVKAPVQERCVAAGLKGCPEVVDGVVLYVEGDEAKAVEKLRAGAAQNSPEDIRKFAQKLLEMSGVPGASQFAGPVTQVAKLLIEAQSATAATGTATPSVVAAAPVAAASTPSATPETNDSSAHAASDSAASDREGYALYALTAPVDPTRAETESVLFGMLNTATTCTVAGAVGPCLSRREGPLVVTDVFTMNGCPGHLFVASSFSDNGGMGLHWFVEATPSGLTGARLLVAGGEWLQVVFVPNAKADVRDPRCALTWSGYRPRMVPVRM